MTIVEAIKRDAEKWNIRYVLYCLAHSETDPDTMLRRDEKLYLGGKMVGYITWIGARWTEWRVLKSYSRDYPLTQADHDEFDTWLAHKIAETMT